MGVNVDEDPARISPSRERPRSIFARTGEERRRLMHSTLISVAGVVITG
jgi:hypothetical protein